MKSMDDLVKGIRRSLSLLDNHYVQLVLIAVLVSYSAGLVPNLNKTLSSSMNNMWVRALALLVIMYVSVKDVALAMLLAIAYVLTVHMSGGNVEGMDNVAPASEEEEGDGDTDENTAEPFSSVEGMDGSAPSGYNSSNNSCLQNCANGDTLPTGDVSAQCGSVATWNNENNAQGMNCPMGYGGDELATF